jgi:hypothetical protein
VIADASRQRGVRIAELVATLSYAADLGLGQPMEHCMRRTVIALRLADLAGATDDDREATFYLGLMMNACCHADATEQAMWFGDEIRFKSDGFEMLDMNTPQMISFLLRRIGSHGSGIARARRLASFPVLVEVFNRLHGLDGARAMARRNPGTEFDAGLVDMFLANAPATLDSLDKASDWNAMLDAEAAGRGHPSDAASGPILASGRTRPVASPGQRPDAGSARTRPARWGGHPMTPAKPRPNVRW